MTVLTVLGECTCGINHTIPVPDESEIWTQKDAERVVCVTCKTTVENLKLSEPDRHSGMKSQNRPNLTGAGI